MCKIVILSNGLTVSHVKDVTRHSEPLFTMRAIMFGIPDEVLSFQAVGGCLSTSIDVFRKGFASSSLSQSSTFVALVIEDDVLHYHMKLFISMFGRVTCNLALYRWKGQGVH